MHVQFFHGQAQGHRPQQPVSVLVSGEKTGVIYIPPSDVLPMQSEVTHEGRELVPKRACSADDEEKETGPESVQLDNTAAVVGEEVPSTLKPKTTLTVNPVTHPIVLDCLPEGPSMLDLPTFRTCRKTQCLQTLEVHLQRMWRTK